MGQDILVGKSGIDIFYLQVAESELDCFRDFFLSLLLYIFHQFAKVLTLYHSFRLTLLFPLQDLKQRSHRISLRSCPAHHLFEAIKQSPKAFLFYPPIDLGEHFRDFEVANALVDELVRGEQFLGCF